MDAIDYLEKSSSECSENKGDICVKVSSILQGQGKLSLALEYLARAKDVYKDCIGKSDNAEDEVLTIKLIETITGIANIYVDEREIEKASDTYRVSGKAYLQ